MSSSVAVFKEIFKELSNFSKTVSDLLAQHEAEMAKHPAPLHSSSNPQNRPATSTSSSSLPDHEAFNKPPKKRKHKRKPVPGAPRRPLTAYMLFCNEYRPTALQLHPGAKTTELGTYFGKKWNSLSDNEKAPYQQRELVALQQYKKEKEEFENLRKSSAALDVGNRPNSQQSGGVGVGAEEEGDEGEDEEEGEEFEDEEEDSKKSKAGKRRRA